MVAAVGGGRRVVAPAEQAPPFGAPAGGAALSRCLQGWGPVGACGANGAEPPPRAPRLWDHWAACIMYDVGPSSPHALAGAFNAISSVRASACTPQRTLPSTLDV